MEQKLGRAWSLGCPLNRAARATGLHAETIRSRIKKEKNKEINKPVMDVVKSVHKSLSPPKVSKLVLDKEVVRETISEMKQQSVTVSNPAVQKKLKEKGIEVSVATVARTVKQLK